VVRLAKEKVAVLNTRLGELVDEETTRKFSELNIITEITEPQEGNVKVKFTPLSPYSPNAVETGRRIKQVCAETEGVKSAAVECSGHMMDELVNRLVNGEKRKR
jgi:metal-sulfur cluster biosynthetic enzyme